MKLTKIHNLKFNFSVLKMNHFDLIGNYLLDPNLNQILQIFSPRFLFHQHKKYIIKVFLLKKLQIINFFEVHLQFYLFYLHFN